MNPTQDDLLALEEAQEQILEAIETLRQVQRSTDNEWARRYIIAHLETVTTSEHEWLDSSHNLDDWIKEVRNQVEGPNLCPRCGTDIDDDHCPNCYWEPGMCLDKDCDRIIGDMDCPEHGSQDTIADKLVEATPEWILNGIK